MSISGNFVRWGLAAVGGAAMYAANKFYFSSDKPVKEEKKLNNDEMKQTKEMYDRLKLGNYSEEKIQYLHSKDIDKLTAKEIYDQLSTYASFGLGTSLNRSLNRVEQKDSSVQDPIYKVYQEEKVVTREKLIVKSNQKILLLKEDPWDIREELNFFVQKKLLDQEFIDFFFK